MAWESDPLQLDQVEGLEDGRLEPLGQRGEQAAGDDQERHVIMSDSTRPALAASIAAGYLLGRSGKAKVALALAAYLTSKKLRAKPQDLLAMATKRVGESPQLSELTDRMRGELLTVGREALKALADRRLGAFADSLADRTKSLSEAVETVTEELDEVESEDEEDDEREPQGEANGDRPQTKGAKPSRRAPAAPGAPASKATRKAPPKKIAKRSEKAAAKKSPAEQSRRRR